MWWLIALLVLFLVVGPLVALIIGKMIKMADKREGKCG